MFKILLEDFKKSQFKKINYDLFNLGAEFEFVSYEVINEKKIENFFAKKGFQIDLDYEIKSDGSIVVSDVPNGKHPVEIVFPIRNGCPAREFLKLLPVWFEFINTYGSTKSLSVGLHIGISFANQKTQENVNFLKLILLLAEQKIINKLIKGRRTNYIDLLQDKVIKNIKNIIEKMPGKNYYDKVVALFDIKNKEVIEDEIKRIGGGSLHYYGINFLEAERRIKDYIEFRYAGSFKPSDDNTVINEGVKGYSDPENYQIILQIINNYLVALYYSQYNVNEMDKYLFYKIYNYYVKYDKAGKEFVETNITISAGKDFVKLNYEGNIANKIVYYITDSMNNKFLLKFLPEKRQVIFGKDFVILLFNNNTFLFYKKISNNEIGYLSGEIKIENDEFFKKITTTNNIIVNLGKDVEQEQQATQQENSVDTNEKYDFGYIAIDIGTEKELGSNDFVIFYDEEEKIYYLF